MLFCIIVRRCMKRLSILQEIHMFPIIIKYQPYKEVKMKKKAKMRRKRAFDALKKLIIFSAIIHLIILITYSVWYSDAAKVNYFNILEVRLLFPGFIVGQIVSILVMVLTYAVIYRYFTRR